MEVDVLSWCLWDFKLDINVHSQITFILNCKRSGRMRDSSDNAHIQLTRTKIQLGEEESFSRRLMFTSIAGLAGFSLVADMPELNYASSSPPPWFVTLVLLLGIMVRIPIKFAVIFVTLFSAKMLLMMNEELYVTIVGIKPPVFPQSSDHEYLSTESLLLLVLGYFYFRSDEAARRAFEMRRRLRDMTIGPKEAKLIPHEHQVGVVATAVHRLFNRAFRNYDMVSNEVQQIVKEVKAGLPKDDLERLNNKEVEFGAFELERKLASGGFCTVFRAHWKQNQRQCAVKSFSSADRLNASVLRGLVNEVVVLSTLRHNHIISVWGYCWTPQVCLVMEYMAKGTLHDMLAYKPLSVTWEVPLLGLAHQISDAISYLHTRNPPIIHRDIKSRNILMKDYRTCKLADFGLMVVEGSDQARAGTLRYIAPEVIDRVDFSQNTTTADIWSFGVCLWEMATRAQFAGLPDVSTSTRRRGVVSPSNRDTMDTDRALFSTTLPYESPRSVYRVLQESLNPDPEKRTMSALEIEALFSDALNSPDIGDKTWFCNDDMIRRCGAYDASESDASSSREDRSSTTSSSSVHRQLTVIEADADNVASVITGGGGGGGEHHYNRGANVDLSTDASMSWRADNMWSSAGSSGSRGTIPASFVAAKLAVRPPSQTSSQPPPPKPQSAMQGILSRLAAVEDESKKDFNSKSGTWSSDRMNVGKFAHINPDASRAEEQVQRLPDHSGILSRLANADRTARAELQGKTETSTSASDVTAPGAVSSFLDRFSTFGQVADDQSGEINNVWVPAPVTLIGDVSRKTASRLADNDKSIQFDDLPNYKSGNVSLISRFAQEVENGEDDVLVAVNLKGEQGETFAVSELSSKDRQSLLSRLGNADRAAVTELQAKPKSSLTALPVLSLGVESTMQAAGGRVSSGEEEGDEDDEDNTQLTSPSSTASSFSPLPCSPKKYTTAAETTAAAVVGRYALFEVPKETFRAVARMKSAERDDEIRRKVQQSSQQNVLAELPASASFSMLSRLAQAEADAREEYQSGKPFLTSSSMMVYNARTRGGGSVRSSSVDDVSVEAIAPLPLGSSASSPDGSVHALRKTPSNGEMGMEVASPFVFGGRESQELFASITKRVAEIEKEQLEYRIKNDLEFDFTSSEDDQDQTPPPEVEVVIAERSKLQDGVGGGSSSVVVVVPNPKEKVVNFHRGSSPLDILCNDVKRILVEPEVITNSPILKLLGFRLDSKKRTGSASTQPTAELEKRLFEPENTVALVMKKSSESGGGEDIVWNDVV